jgi:signal transduction histidine kinase
VAVRWRIRHKLMIGLALVVAIMSLQLAGTFRGLYSYNTTIKSIESKLTELDKAKDIVEITGRFLTPEVRGEEMDDRKRLEDEITEARKKLTAYQDTLQHTLERQRDPDHGTEELEYIKVIGAGLNKLEDAIEALSRARVVERTQSVLEDEKVKLAAQEVAGSSNDLAHVIQGHIFSRIRDARDTFNHTLITVSSVSVAGVLLLAGLLRTFYRWVFNPIRDLEEGAGRLAQGEFDYRIDVHSHDEMEDLAAAFNDMAGRLQEIYRDLAHQVNERSRQLVRSERLASVGFLAAGVAHEINNPLASIAFCSEALESRIGEVLGKTDVDGGTILKYLRMIQDEAFRCKNITQKLLEFSRTNERRRESTDLGQLIHSVLEMVQHLQNSKGKQIVFEPAIRVPAWINAQEIKSVVLNLVVNALESMEEGGTLTITLGSRNRRAEITFADTGCGMSQETLDNIFEPFFTKSRTGKGTGLGLSISHRVITQHEGEIEASSPGVNQGSTFIVRLPMFPAEAVKEDTLGQRAA